MRWRQKTKAAAEGRVEKARERARSEKGSRTTKGGTEGGRLRVRKGHRQPLQ